MSRHLVAILMAILMVCSIASAQSPPGIIAHSSKGFDKQYHQLLNAYLKNDGQKLNAELDKFALPATWFTKVIGEGDGPELYKEYSEQFDVFKSSTIRRLRGIPRCPACIINLQTKLVYYTESKILPSPTEPKSDSSSVPSLPPLERFEIRYIAEEFSHDTDGTGQNFTRETPLGNASWMDSFIYVEGAFRFFGKGARIFSEPVRTRLADPCSPNGTQPGGRLLFRVEPQYPEEARRVRISGIVRVLVTVAEDGSVKDATVLGGDKLLAEVARQAVVQWRYAPFMNCGKPVEMQLIEHVRVAPK